MCDSAGVGQGISDTHIQISVGTVRPFGNTGMGFVDTGTDFR